MRGICELCGVKRDSLNEAGVCRECRDPANRRVSYDNTGFWIKDMTGSHNPTRFADLSDDDLLTLSAICLQEHQERRRRDGD